DDAAGEQAHAGFELSGDQRRRRADTQRSRADGGLATMSLTPTLLANAAVAGAIVVLSPGPGVIALPGIGAAPGRREGAKFLIGHLGGDLLWSTLALVALVGAKLVAPWIFNALATFCGIYLTWLGLRSLLARRSASGVAMMQSRRPLLRGVAFGLSN